MATTPWKIVEQRDVGRLAGWGVLEEEDLREPRPLIPPLLPPPLGAQAAPVPVRPQPVPSPPVEAAPPAPPIIPGTELTGLPPAGRPPAVPVQPVPLLRIPHAAPAPTPAAKPKKPEALALPPEQQAAVEAAWQDPKFHGLALEERRRRMSALDPNFAQLPLADQNRLFSQRFRPAGTPPAPVVPGAEVTGLPPVPTPPVPAGLERPPAREIVGRGGALLEAAEPAPGEFRAAMAPVLTGEVAQLLPQPTTNTQAVANALIQTAAGAMSAETLAIMLGAGAASQVLKAAVNLPQVARMLREFPNVAKAVDIASKSAIPGAFSGLAAGAGIVETQVARTLEGPEAVQHGVTAAADFLLAGLAGGAAARTARGAAAQYPPAEIPTGRSARQAAAVARETAGELARRGERLAAEQWAKTAQGVSTEAWVRVFGEDIPINLAGKEVTIRYGGTDPKGRPHFNLVDDASGEVRYSGTGQAILDYLRMRGAKARAPAAPAAEPAAEVRPAAPAAEVPAHPAAKAAGWKPVEVRPIEAPAARPPAPEARPVVPPSVAAEAVAESGRGVLPSILPETPQPSAISPPARPAEAPAKEPWQMTREEFTVAFSDKLKPFGKLGLYSPPPEWSVALPDGSHLRFDNLPGREPLNHARRVLVKLALQEGKPVPPEVLADYPDLAKLAEERPVVPRARGDEGPPPVATPSAEVPAVAPEVPAAISPPTRPREAVAAPEPRPAGLGHPSQLAKFHRDIVEAQSDLANLRQQLAEVEEGTIEHEDLVEQIEDAARNVDRLQAEAAKVNPLFRLQRETRIPLPGLPEGQVSFKRELLDDSADLGRTAATEYAADYEQWVERGKKDEPPEKPDAFEEVSKDRPEYPRRWLEQAAAEFQRTFDQQVTAGLKQIEAEAEKAVEPVPAAALEVPAAPKPEAKPEAPAPITKPQEATFREAYDKFIAETTAGREKLYPYKKLKLHWDTLTETGKVQIDLPGGRTATITTLERTEGKGKKRHTIKSYQVVRPNGDTYTYDWEGDVEWARGKALAQAVGQPGITQELVGAIRREGDWSSVYEKQYALREGLKAAFPDRAIPDISSVVHPPAEPTLKDALQAVAESLPRNLGEAEKGPSPYTGFSEDYAAGVERSLKPYEEKARLAATIIGETHPRVRELRGLIEQRRTKLREEGTQAAEKQRKVDETTRQRVEVEARAEAEYHARFGSLDVGPQLERYAELSGWTETGLDIADRAVKEFGIEAKRLKALDLSDVKMTEGQRNILREVKLAPAGTFLPRRITLQQEEWLKQQGWLEQNGVSLTELGERAVLAVLEQEAESVAGRPISEYVPKNKRLPDPGESRFAINRAIDVDGEAWHTDGHAAIKGPPPKYWIAHPPREGEKPPDLKRVLPKERGGAVQPVAFTAGERIKGRNIDRVFFSSGSSVEALYFDYVNKLHGPVAWAEGKPTEGTPVAGLEAWKGKELVAIVMPMRAEDLPVNVARLIKEAPPAPVGHPAARAKAKRALPVPRETILPETVSKVPAAAAGVAQVKPPEPGVAPGIPPPAPETLVAPRKGHPAARGARPALPAPAPVRAGVQEPVSRAEILNEISGRFGKLPIRVGRFRERAHGIFKVKPEVVRTRQAQDLPVAFHEIGHYINKLLWGAPGDKLNWRPLDPFRDELTPIATKPRAGESPLPEGFAEFVRLYVTDPAQAQQKAPGFHRWFEGVLDQNPDLKETLLNARAQVARYINQPALAYVESMIVRDKETKPWATWEGFYTAMVDAGRPIQTAVRWMADKSGTGVPSENAYDLFRVLPGVVEKANHFLEFGTFDPVTLAKTGPPLKEILEPVKDRLQQFEDYLVGQRVLEKEAQGIKTGFDKARVEQALDEVEQKGYTAEFEQVAQKFYKWKDAVLEYLLRRRVYSAEQIARMRAANTRHVAFYRVFEEGAAGRRPGARGKMADLAPPIHRMRGSERQIHPPLESAVKDLFSFISMAERNHVGQALVEQAGKTDRAGWLVEEVPAPLKVTKFRLEEIRKRLEEAGADLEDADLETLAMVFRPMRRAPAGQNILTVVFDGKPRFFQVEPELSRAMLALDHETANMVVQILARPARLLRLGATGLSFRFAVVRNPIRDAWQAFMQSEYGFTPGLDSIRGLFHVLGKTELYQEWVRSGAPHSAMVSIDRTHMEKTLRELLAHPLANAARHPVEALRALSELTEAMTRVQEYALARKAGKTPLQAAVASQEVTLAFQRMGASTRAVNMIIAFWNANVQGADKFARVHRDHPKRTLLRGLLGLTIPSLLLYLLNRDDKDYQEQPRYVKDFFWLIPTRGTPLHETTPFIPIPKPFLWGQVYSTIPERVMEWIDKRDAKAFDRLWTAVLESAAPGFLPTGLAVPIEWITNYNLFTGRPIESEYLKGLPAKYRAQPWTTQFSRFVAEALDRVGIQVSPLKLDNAIRGATGGAGQDVLAAIDIAVGKEGLPRRMADIPGAGALAVRWPTTQAESVQRLYDRLEKLRAKQSAYRAGARYPAGPAAGARGPTPEEAAELARLEAAARTIAGLNRWIRAAYGERMPAARKQQEIDAHTRQIIDIARTAMREQPVRPLLGHPAVRAAARR